jgi:hypothetical protein
MARALSILVPTALLLAIGINVIGFALADVLGRALH